MIYVTMELR